MIPHSPYLWAVTVLLLAVPAWSHVSLTYPPARKYNLDFLDNGRTPPPCGMPKGDIKTSLIQGTTVNVTWHLGYPHQGGFYLELLDSDEKHKMFLTPPALYTTRDTTAQHFVLDLPSDLVCRNCTIRLIRRAKEWGSNYRFWSCADVDILPRFEVKRNCNKKGRYISNRCLCNSGFHGTDCQYENECEMDKDCGSRFGKCVDLDATSYPKKQCFCSRGHFGRKCEKSSHIRSASQVNLGEYTKRPLGEALTLYWRVLPSIDQIEVVLVNKGQSYAALGWRPASADASCRDFPRIEGPRPPRNYVLKEPPYVKSASSSNGAVAEPEPEPEGKYSAEPEPEPQGKSSAEPEPNGKYSAEPEPQGKSVGSGPKLKKSTANKSEPEPQPESNYEPEPEPNSSSEPEPTDDDSTNRPFSLADRLAQFSGRRLKRDAQLKDSMIPLPLLKPAKRITLPTTTEAKAEPEPKTTSEPESSPESEPHSTPKVEPEPNAEVEPETSPKSEVEPEPNTEVEPETSPKSEPEPQTSSKSEPEPSSFVEPEYKSHSSSKPEPKSEWSSGSSREPRYEPEPEAKAEGEPEPNAEGEPEPNAEGEPEPNAEGEPEPNAEGEPEPEPQDTSDNNNGVFTYKPFGNRLHPMDCTDIVVGTARGSFYRVFDYYTRDRSTPRLDTFWGGEDSLTAVFGWEKDGETTFLFRKNLTATHPTDQSITNAMMNVIWARGQEPQQYIHSPPSGLEVGNPSIPEFYKPDELKYHGKGPNQRGTASINFFEADTNLAQAGGANGINWCGGLWKYPQKCSYENGTCEYYAKWEYLEKTDEIDFTVATSHTDKWTGIGFSKNLQMAQTDVVLGWVNPQGNYYMYDGFLMSKTPPSIDAQEDIKRQPATLENGITTLRFQRKRQTGDKERDFEFTDSQCLYLVFPVRGGKVNYKSKRIQKHQGTPTFSPEPICIRSCVKFGGVDGKPFVVTTTPRPKNLVYQVGFKIKMDSNVKIHDKGTTEYKHLVETILSSTTLLFDDIPGFKGADVVELDNSEKGNLKVETRVTIDKEQYEEANGPVKTAQEELNAKQNVFSLLESEVKKGTIGNFNLEPSYLTVDYLKADQDIGKVMSDGATVEKALTPLAFMSEHKYWFIGAGIVALIVLALLQAVINSCRKARSQPPPVSAKERLMTSNSRWRDFSRDGSANYAFETFESEAAAEQAATTAGAMNRENKKNKKSTPPNVNSNGIHKETKENGTGVYPPGYMDNYNSRSLQRRPPEASAVLSDPRTTYSLPRGSSASSAPPPYAPNDINETPDFYYLPSQRKYTGEVVRVFVDYNQAK